MVLLLSYRPSSQAARAELRLARLVLRIHASKTDLRLATEDQKKQYTRLINTKICKYSSEDTIYRLILTATLLSWELRDQVRAEIQDANGQKLWFSEFHKESYGHLEVKFNHFEPTTGTYATAETEIARAQIPTGANTKLREKLAQMFPRAVPKGNSRKPKDVSLWIQRLQAAEKILEDQAAARATAAKVPEEDKL
ncbi:hypothetical protein PpBr36_02665 [Pyricularia pennisetigena]|uniref:hypothetical protein n=1 Tax=Pyricularia pennisetigena TaxID=1578925 RepID=UPI0011545152|nr:hypothetical protein PpBr36_02665 [Pyricularia pennisetigena]TLS30844.1 hypothetical protein PpBr36_02665 [Pyricularia pennisetigena]